MNKYVKYTIIAVIILIIIVVLVILNINKKNKDNVNDVKTKIVTSFYPMYIIAENLLEDTNNTELINMADVNVGCLHDYTLTTEDMKKVENADIFIINGLGMENFLDKVINSNKDMYIIDSSTNIQNLIKDENEINPHIWTSIDNYILQVKNISKELQNKDTLNAQTYKENEKKIHRKVRKFKRRIFRRIKRIRRTESNNFK